MHRVKQRPWLAVGVVAPRVAAEGVVESVEKKMSVVNNALETSA